MDQTNPIANLLVRMPEPKRITGRVVDQAGNPIRNERVVFTPRFDLLRERFIQGTGQGEIKSSTDSEGIFYLEYTETLPSRGLSISVNQGGRMMRVYDDHFDGKNSFDPELGDLTIRANVNGQ